MANRYNTGEIDYTNRGYDQVRFRVPSHGEGNGNLTRESQGGSIAYQPSSVGSGSAAGRGPYRGLGPRNYQRSDARIMEDICDRLTEHGYLDARDMEVQVHEGVVSLEGMVNDQYSRRIAQDLAEDVTGVLQVHNNLSVNYPFHNEEPATQVPVMGNNVDPGLNMLADGAD